LQERIDASIEKNVKRLVMLREFQRQYGDHDSTLKVIEHRPSKAQPLSSKRAKSFTGNAAEVAKKTSAANDDWEANDNNDNNDDIDPEEFDHEHEYDEYLAEKARRKESR
jgi:hypothetical protein